MTEFEKRIKDCTKGKGFLPDGFGVGWMSNPAIDMLKIAVHIAGFDKDDMVTAISFLQQGRLAKVNVSTVEKAMALLTSIWDKDHSNH